MDDTKFYVIINVTPGRFEFSTRFVDELGTRLNKELHEFDTNYRVCQTACALLLEKGSKWSSGACVRLRLYTVPMFLKDYIRIDETEYDEVLVLLSDKFIVDKTREMLANPTPEAIEILKRYISQADESHIERVSLKL